MRLPARAGGPGQVDCVARRWESQECRWDQRLSMGSRVKKKQGGREG
jgi:hypothetical protein